MPSGKCETERKGNAPVNTGPSPNSDGRTNNTVEEADEHARGSGPLTERITLDGSLKLKLFWKQGTVLMLSAERQFVHQKMREIKAWKKRDALARSIISRSLDDFHYAFIRSCKTSKEMMNCIVKIKEQATVSSKLLVSSEFHAYTWKPGMNVASFIAGLNVIVNKMQSLQIELDDEIIIGKVIQCLPSDFDSFRQSWRLSAPKTVTLSDLTSQLLACESDQLCRSMQAVSIGEALVGKRTTSKELNENSKKRNIECWNCKKKGHIRSECRSQRKLNSSTLKDRTKSLNRTGFVARSWLDIRQEPNDGWLADSGAFKHITRNRHWFSTLEIIEPQGVRIGNDKMIYAVGIGTIDVEVFNGKQWIASVLSDVLYVPEFGCSYLFSFGAAAACGYKR
ncbi:Retrovirus-related Pol polyprotein from transposon TNT 1-94 [Trichinella patagoniensis]|uniref:Retrovirus-related Pol polyprotein from transposon TNT 1-94 n=1 Tax=Trichinella patagoniensis TaxID=990121 RepID=A0A0V0ZVE8_9BILA|nr:Retrovirus-related Pol polyprotein from transposon TNT 1-94 [Trichinella patagoniensis]